MNPTITLPLPVMESFDLQEELQGLADVASYSFDNETDVSALDASSIAHDVLEPAVSASPITPTASRTPPSSMPTAPSSSTPPLSKAST